MTLTEIKEAVRAGKVVHWASLAYIVTNPRDEVWNIVCSHNKHTIGLTWTDGVTLNGEPGDFFVGEKKES